MDKEKEIAEMVGILAASNNPFIDVPIEIIPKIAEVFYNAGYRKVPDGAVVLLIGENNQALDEKTIEYFVKHNEQIRKETAREILQAVDNESNGQTISITNYLRGKFGVEVEE